MSFAIVTPSFNKEKYLRRCLVSVLEQNHPDVSYWVLDNCSTDGSARILEETLRKYPGRVEVIVETDGGQSDAINRGFSLAKGEIMAWLNADDSYLPDTLSRVEEFFQKNPHVDLVYGKTRILTGNYSVVGSFPARTPDLHLLKSFDYISQPAAFWRRRVWESVGPLDVDLYWGMDWDFFLRACKQFRVAFLDQYLAEAVCDGDHKSAQRSSTLTKELALIGRRHDGFLNPTHLFCQFILLVNWFARPFLRHRATAPMTMRIIESLRSRSMTFLSRVFDVHVMS